MKNKLEGQVHLFGFIYLDLVSFNIWHLNLFKYKIKKIIVMY